MEDILNNQNHYKVCYYNKGALFELVDPGPENKAERGVVDEVLRLSKKSGSIPNFVNHQVPVHLPHQEEVLYERGEQAEVDGLQAVCDPRRPRAQYGISRHQNRTVEITEIDKTQVELAMRADVSHSKELAHVLEAFKAARLAEVIQSEGELICSHLVKP